MQVIDMPLLFETGNDSLMASVIVVTCTPAQQKQRLQQRNNLGPDAAQQRIDAQMPMHEKLARATYIVDNSGSVQATRAQVLHLADMLPIFTHACQATIQLYCNSRAGTAVHSANGTDTPWHTM